MACANCSHLCTHSPLRQALSVGDQIRISARSGAEEAIEVVALEQFDGESLGLAGMQLQIVTGRPVASEATETVRFLFAVDAPGTVNFPAKAGRSL